MDSLKKQGISCNGRNTERYGLSNEDRPPPESATPMDIMRNPNIRKKFFILAFDWVANAVVYNGLSYNTTNLGVSDYLAFFIGKYSTHTFFFFSTNISFLFYNKFPTIRDFKSSSFYILIFFFLNSSRSLYFSLNIFSLI